MAELSYLHGISDRPLLGATIGGMLRQRAAEHGDREALGRRCERHPLDLSRAGRTGRCGGHGDAGLGVARGDRIGIWAPNVPEWVLVQYATARIGAILVNINPAYRTRELRYVLNQAGVRDAGGRARIPGLRLSRDDRRGAAGMPRPDHRDLPGRPARPGRRRGSGGPRTGAVQFDDPVNIQYTSGTTGFPKGATLSHHNILNNGYFVGLRQGWTADDRVCVPVPFYHCFGSVVGTLAALTHAACMVVPAPAFDPLATLAAVAQERCTALYGVPTMFIAELSDPAFGTFDLSSLRTGIMAGSPCPVEIMKRVITEMGMRDVTICYGMTETSPVATQTRPSDDIDLRVSTVGVPLPHVETKIVDPATGLTVPRGVAGEFCTRGYSVMLGYWAMPDQTADAIDEARWMHTGDLAVMSEDGYVAIVGRIKDVIIRGGENIYPAEIEEFLHTHPGIRDVQVIGVPDPVYGEEVMAWVIPNPGASPLTAESLRAFCDGRLARYKIPRYVKLVDTFPMTVTGKIRKVEMRDQSVKDLDLAPQSA